MHSSAFERPSNMLLGSVGPDDATSKSKLSPNYDYHDTSGSIRQLWKHQVSGKFRVSEDDASRVVNDDVTATIN
jgi:hypothetical protein